MKQQKNEKGIVVRDLCDILEVLPNIRCTMQDEVRLNLDIVEVEDNYRIKRFAKFDDFIRLSDGHIRLDKDVVKVPYKFFEDMYNEAIKLTKGDSRYITALKIHLGFEDGGMKLLFQPLMTYFNSLTGGYSVVESTVIRDAQNNDYTQATLDTLTANYRAIIRVKRAGETRFKCHLRGTDTDAVIYPFQTIFALIKDNMPEDDCILIRNCLGKDNTSGVQDDYLQKHAVILIAQKLQSTLGMSLLKHLEQLSFPINEPIGIPGILLSNLRDKYANRSHLCPPGCSLITDYEIDNPTPTKCTFSSPCP